MISVESVRRLVAGVCHSVALVLSVVRPGDRRNPILAVVPGSTGTRLARAGGVGTGFVLVGVVTAGIASGEAGSTCAACAPAARFMAPLPTVFGAISAAAAAYLWVNHEWHAAYGSDATGSDDSTERVADYVDPHAVSNALKPAKDVFDAINNVDDIITAFRTSKEFKKSKAYAIGKRLRDALGRNRIVTTLKKATSALTVLKKSALNVLKKAKPVLNVLKRVPVVGKIIGYGVDIGRVYESYKSEGYRIGPKTGRLALEVAFQTAGAIAFGSIGFTAGGALAGPVGGAAGLVGGGIAGGELGGWAGRIVGDWVFGTEGGAGHGV